MAVVHYIQFTLLYIKVKSYDNNQKVSYVKLGIQALLGSHTFSDIFNFRKETNKNKKKTIVQISISVG